MRPRSRIVWKLSLVFLVLLAVVVAVAGPAFAAMPSSSAVLVAAAAVLLVLPLFWAVTSRSVDRPIRTLTAGMGKLGEEHFGFRFDIRCTDEFGTLAESFNTMATKLERTLTELRETRDYFEGIVENSADIIITVNPRGYVYTFNRGAELALGFDRSEVIGRSAEMLFADQREREEAIERMRGVEDLLNYETHLRTRDGGMRDVILTLSRLRDPEGRTLGAFGIGKDVTEANRMQRQLLQAEKFAAIGQALAGIQHALKNMLNAMKGGAYMVKVGLRKDDRALLEEGWGMVRQGIEAVTGMTSQMLAYVREGRAEFAEVDLSRVVREIEQVFRRTAEDRGCRLLVTAAEDAPRVRCDRRLMHTAVMDILSNALDAVLEKEFPPGEGPEIAVRAGPHEADGRFVVSIRDNGCGMPKEVRANLFTPFFSTKKSSGTGLGLALTARTIRLHGGEIEVDSEENVGTEFRIIVPVGGPDQPKEGPDGQEGAGR